MKNVRLVAILGSVMLIAGCSAFKEGFKQGLNQSGYSDEMKKNYMQACVAAAAQGLTEDKARTYCECTFDKASSTIPVDEWVKFDSGETIKEETRTSLKVAIAQCGGDASSL